METEFAALLIRQWTGGALCAGCSAAPGKTRAFPWAAPLPAWKQQEFGHGLSYTTFIYRDLQASPPQAAPDGAFEVRLEVKNSGTRTGDEVVQVIGNRLNASNWKILS